MYLLRYTFLLTVLAAFMACEPYVEDKTDLGPLPDPSFDIIEGDTPNDFNLINTTEGAFITQWDLGEVGQFEGSPAAINIPFKGTYEVTMTTLNRGGSATLTKTLTVTEDAPLDCIGNVELLTGCGEKVWYLAPEPAAMHIGPNLNETWWGNSVGDVSARECHFNDKYIFRINGEFEFDNQGDFWADDNGSGVVWPADLGLEIGCNDSDDWPEAYSAWDSGVYTFSVTENSLSVIGLGAYIGLYKAGTNDEVVTPQPSTTYSIAELTEDRMVIFADYGWGVWRFTLVAE